MTDRVMALLAFLFLLGFLGILVWFVPRLDLGAVVAVTLAPRGLRFLYDAAEQAGQLSGRSARCGPTFTPNPISTGRIHGCGSASPSSRAPS